MAWAPFKGQGTTISHAGITGRVTGLSIDGIKCNTDDVTGFPTTTARVFLAGLIDPGSIKVDALFNPTAVPAIDGASGEFTISFSDPDTTDWTFNGFMTGFSSTLQNETASRCSFTLKLTGPIT